MNAENINKVADAIEQHSIPELGFNMCWWQLSGAAVEPGDDMSGHNCGTVACIGGWTNAVAGQKQSPSDAAAFLGIDEEQSDQLFYMFDTRRDMARVTATDAVRVLRHLASTGVVDWSVALPSKETTSE